MSAEQYTKHEFQVGMCDNKIELIEAPAVYGTKTDERLYLIQGNVIHGPVHEIVIGPEIQYPPPVERPQGFYPVRPHPRP